MHMQRKLLLDIPIIRRLYPSLLRRLLKLFKLMEYNKIITEAINEEREEIFEMYKTTIQLITKINPRFNEIAKSTPR